MIPLYSYASPLSYLSVYKGDSVSMFTADPGVRTRSFGNRKARTGKYRIDGYTLTLTYMVRLPRVA